VPPGYKLPLVSVANNAAPTDPTRPNATKRPHAHFSSKPKPSNAVIDDDIEFAPSPVRGAKRVQIRATPTKIKQIRADLSESFRLEKLNTIGKRRLDDDTTLTDDQRKWKTGVYAGLMAPSGEALNHPAADMLLEFATTGCPVDTGPKWSKDMLNAALKKGAHPSALDPIASAQLRAESLEKADQGFCRLVAWNDIAENPPQNLKISPIAAVPHKSRGFRMILDLSYGVSIEGERMPSVNEATNDDVAPSHSMAELGNVLPRLIYAVGTAPDTKGPVLFSKLDIKDGFWRMVVPAEDEWNFAYVLPKKNQQDPNEPTVLVIPSSLQMGWTHSPANFCAASETARDVNETIVQQPIGSLPPHALEPFMMPSDLPALRAANPQEAMDADIKHIDDFCRLLESFVDDFIGLAQTTDEIVLRHLSRSMLEAILSVFPPPEVTGHAGEHPVSMKKLLEGDGVWDVRKEILGWMFDGAKRCIELPEDKVTSLLQQLHTTARAKSVDYKAFEKLRGRLRHACIGIPAGRGLMGPIDKALTTVKSQVGIASNPLLHECLRDFHTIIKIMGKRPSFCRELIPDTPEYVGYCDASKLGAGGVWMSGSSFLTPTVWRLEFPQDIQDRVVAFSNPTGDITNSDLEMAGLLGEYLVLEHLAPLKLSHAAAWCDNTPTVSWANKMSSSKSMVAARLVRALAMRLHINQASPLVTWSIAGVKNIMADVASRFFNKSRASGETFAISDTEFLQMFNSKFPHPQADSWQIFRFSDKLSSLIFSELRGLTSTLGSLLRLPKKGSAIGIIGETSSSPSILWTPCSPGLEQTIPLTLTQKSPSLALSLDGSGAVRTPETVGVSVAKRFKSRYVPSARRSNWTENPIQRTDPRDDTGSHSNSSSKGTDERIQQRKRSWQSQSR